LTPQPGLKLFYFRADRAAAAPSAAGRMAFAEKGISQAYNRSGDDGEGENGLE